MWYGRRGLKQTTILIFIFFFNMTKIAVDIHTCVRNLQRGRVYNRGGGSCRSWSEAYAVLRNLNISLRSSKLCTDKVNVPIATRCQLDVPHIYDTFFFFLSSSYFLLELPLFHRFPRESVFMLVLFHLRSLIFFHSRKSEVHRLRLLNFFLFRNL